MKSASLVLALFGLMALATPAEACDPFGCPVQGVGVYGGFNQFSVTTFNGVANPFFVRSRAVFAPVAPAPAFGGFNVNINERRGLFGRRNTNINVNGFIR